MLGRASAEVTVPSGWEAPSLLASNKRGWARGGVSRLGYGAYRVITGGGGGSRGAGGWVSFSF